MVIMREIPVGRRVSMHACTPGHRVLRRPASAGEVLNYATFVSRLPFSRYDADADHDPVQRECKATCVHSRL